MINNEIFNTGLLISVIGGLVLWLKQVPAVIIAKIRQRFVFTATIYENDELFFVFESWLYRNYGGKYRDVEVGYFQANPWAPDAQNNVGKQKKNLSFRHNKNSFVILYGGRKVFIVKDKQKIEGIREGSRLFFSNYSIYGLFSKKIILRLLEEITEEYNRSLDDNRTTFYSFSSSNRFWETMTRRSVKPLRNVILNDDTKQMLTSDLHHFLSNEKWYMESSIIYKRNYLFHGPPGTGKTTLSFALASEAGRNVYMLNLNSLTSDEALQSAFSHVGDNSVMVLEDVDAAFVSRDNQKESKISFSCLLNCLDGAMAKDGSIVIMTTNHIEKLDPALIRDGRVDVRVEVGNATTVEVEQFLWLFYGAPFILGVDVSLPMATVQGACLKHRNNPDEAVREILSSYNQKLKIA